MSTFTMSDKAPKTKRGCVRQYNTILNRCRLDFKGGTQFGIDMPTIAACFPDRYARIMYLKDMYYVLPE